MSMWLDRLAGHSSSNTTPQPSSHSTTPSLPRRTSSRGPYLAPQASASRPNITPRGSNLSLVSNESTSSFLATQKRLNGSTLKQTTTVPEGPDPEIVLETILGPKPNGLTVQDEPQSTITDDALDLDFDFGGLSLREFASIDPSDGGDVYRSQSIEECTFCVITGFPIAPLDVCAYGSLHR